MIAQDRGLFPRGVAMLDRIIGRCGLMVLWLLQPALGVDIAARARQYCQLWCGLSLDELVGHGDYVQVPVGTVIGRWPWSVMLIKHDGGKWYNAAEPDGREYSTAQVCSLGPHQVYGWGQTWA